MVLWIVVLTCLLLPMHSLGQTYKECSPDKTICEYWLIVREKLTMIHKKDLVYAAKGKLYKYDEHPSNYTTEIPIDEVVTVDGVPRMVIAVNNTVPGPLLVVYEDQTLIIHVKNLLLSDSVTIHWHGMHQKGTSFMDGVGYITQCPIGAGQLFSYKFKATPKGTFWYHSHVGAQRTNGVFGALIVKERPKQGTVLPEDRIMNIGDWHHESSEEVYMKMIYGNFHNGIKYKSTQTLDGGKFSNVPWVSGLIEGKGRYTDPITGKTNEAPLTIYTVKQGKSYRFRVIQAGTIFPLRVSVDQHNLTVVASDGYDIKPIEVESFIINPGERFDFLLTAHGPVDNYWIRVITMQENKQHSTSAILRYDGALLTEPTTNRAQCTEASPCHVINCPFRYFPTGNHSICHLMSDLQNADSNDPAPEFVAKDSQEHFLNFAFPGMSVTPGSVNGRKFEFPGVNSLSQGDEITNYDCAKHDCGEDKVCYCHYELKVPFNKTIQMVWLNVGVGAGWGHPIHLHGHSFYVLKMAYPTQNQSDGKIIEEVRTMNPDIQCDGKLQFCNEAKWKNASWNNGNIPGLNLKNPPRKDTLIIPTGGYAVIRIRSNNPGKWFMHCHIEVHALDGMAMVLSEDVERAPEPPKGFPVCQNFYDDQSRNVEYIRKDASTVVTKKEETADCNDKEELLIILLSVFAASTVILIVVIIALVFGYSRRK